MRLKYGTGSEDHDYWLADPSTMAAKAIPEEHSKVHEGLHYEVSQYDLDIDTDEVMSFAFKTPDSDTHLHMVFDPQCSVSALFEICEGATVTAGTGTNQAVMNKDRNSSNTSVIASSKDATAGSVSYGATIAADGTVVRAIAIGADKKSALLNCGRAEQELELKANTTYAIRITVKADNGLASLSLSYYEHEDLH